MSVGYATPPVGLPVRHDRAPSARTAETLVLVALLLQVVGGMFVLGGIAWLFGFSILFPFPYSWAALIAAGGVAVVVVVFLYFAYTLAYLRIRNDDLEGAQTPTLLFGILSLFVGILPGIFYLIGYVKLGDAIRERQTPPGTVAPGATPAPAAQIACRGCSRVYPLGAFTFCPNCGQKLGS